jgi:leader peptidase (prepilin peptidase) / N-methyltransferase
MKVIDWPLALAPLLFALLVYHSWKDIRYLYIESRDLLILSIYTAVNALTLLFNQNYEVLLSNFLGAFLCLAIFLLIWIVTKKRGIGEGEIFYVPIAYFNIGLINTIEALYFCFFSAMLFSLLGLISKRLTKKQALPFIPFLSAGVIFSLLLP